MMFRSVDDYMAWVRHTIDDRLNVLETSLLVDKPIDGDDLDALMADQRAAMARWCDEHRLAFEAWLSTIPEQNR